MKGISCKVQALYSTPPGSPNGLTRTVGLFACGELHPRLLTLFPFGERLLGDIVFLKRRNARMANLSNEDLNGDGRIDYRNDFVMTAEKKTRTVYER